MRRIIFAISLLLGFQSIKASAQNPQAAGKVFGRLKVGLVLPMTGSQKDYGAEALAAIELALADMKTQDSSLLEGVDTELIDDMSSPSGAQKAAEVLVQKRASVLLGSAFPPNSMVLAQAAMNLKVLTILPAYWGGKSLVDNPFVFSSNYDDSWQGHLLAKFALDSELGKKAGILVNSKDLRALEAAQSFTQAFARAGAGAVQRQTYDGSLELNFAEALKSFAFDKVDFIYLPTNETKEIAAFCDEAARQGLKKPVLGNDRLESPAIRAKLAALGGNYFVAPFRTAFAQSERALAFSKAFKEKLYRDPSALAYLMYDGMVTAVHAYKIAGSNDRNELKRALSKLKEAPGLLGPITMNSRHTAEKPALIFKADSSGLLFQRVAMP